jgi:hypothetical protein
VLSVYSGAKNTLYFIYHKNITFVFLLAQVFFLKKRKSVKKALPKKLIN